jgi:hypothetical protein
MWVVADRWGNMAFWQAMEHGLLTDVVPSYQTVEAGVALNRLSKWDIGPPKRGSISVLTVRVVRGLGLSWRSLPSWSGPILCQSRHDPYVCSSRNGTTLPGGDRMDSSSQVPAVRPAWEPVFTSYLVWYLMIVLTEGVGFRTTCPGLEAPGWGYRGPRCVLSRSKMMG